MAIADSENTGEAEDTGGATLKGDDTNEEEEEPNEAKVCCSSKSTCLER
jgi:hypothetical protein